MYLTSKYLLVTLSVLTLLFSGGNLLSTHKPCHALPSSPQSQFFRGARWAFDMGSRVQLNTDSSPSSMSFLGLDFYSDLHFAGKHRGDIVAQVYTFDMRNLSSDQFISSARFDYAPCIIAPNLILLPQGKLNLKFGHIWHPYGLRNQINTTQTLRQLISVDSMGLMLDWGAELHGELNIFSYNLSLGSGSGKWFSRNNDTYMGVMRLGIHGDHPTFSYLPFKIGLSTLKARIQSAQGIIERWRAGLDVQYSGPIGFLFEGSLGEDFNAMGSKYPRDALTAIAELNWRSMNERWMLYFQQRYVSYDLQTEAGVMQSSLNDMTQAQSNSPSVSTLDLPQKHSSTLGLLYSPLNSLFLAAELVADYEKSNMTPRIQARYRW